MAKKYFYYSNTLKSILNSQSHTCNSLYKPWYIKVYLTQFNCLTCFYFVLLRLLTDEKETKINVNTEVHFHIYIVANIASFKIDSRNVFLWNVTIFYFSPGKMWTLVPVGGGMCVCFPNRSGPWFSLLFSLYEVSLSRTFFPLHTLGIVSLPPFFQCTHLLLF